MPRPASVPDVVEDADTLEGNARLKAVAIADGDGRGRRSPTTPASRSTRSTARPGVHSARFAGEDATYADNVAKLLAELDRVGAADARAARGPGSAPWRWCAAPTAPRWSADGTVEGHIAVEPAGRAAASATTRCSCPTTATAAPSPR